MTIFNAEDTAARSLREIHETEIITSLIFWPEQSMDTVHSEVSKGIIPQPEPEDFEYPRHRAIFQAMTELSAERSPMSAHAIAGRAAELAANNFDIHSYIKSLTYNDVTIDPPNLPRYLHGLRVCRDKRDTAEAIAASDPDNIRQVLADIETRSRVSKSLSSTPTEALERVTSALVEPAKETGPRLPLRVPASDRHGNYLRSGAFAILAARPGVGKSIWALRWAMDTSMGSGRPVLYVSYEMDADECWTRAVLSEAHVEDPGAGKLSQEDVRLVSEAREYLAKHCQLQIRDKAPNKVIQLVSYLEREVEKLNAVAVVIDYLGLLSGSGDREYEQMGDISRMIRGYAQRSGTPVLGVHQFNRSSVGERRPPDLHDLRGSGQLEQDATHVMFLDHPWLRMNEKERGEYPAAESEVIWRLRKARRGRPCFEKMLLRGAMSRLDPIHFD